MSGLCAPLALRRIPQDIAHAGVALAAGRVWRTTGDTWNRFELHWQAPGPSHRWLVRTGAGLLGLTDLTLLQLGSGVLPGLDGAQDAFDDAARLACACMDQELAQALGGPLQWEPGEPAAAPGGRAARHEARDAACISLRLVLLPARGEDQHALTLCMPADALAALLCDERWEPLPPYPMAPWLDGLPCDARMCIASVCMPLAQLQSLRCGDLVVLSEVSHGLRGISSLQLGRIVIGFDARQDAHIDTFEFRSWRWADTRPETERILMSEPAPDEHIPVDSVQVTLEVICGRTSLSVGALRALRPGSLLQMGCPASAQVELVVGGVRVGAGELVQVDGWLAVEVRQLGRP